MRLPLGWLKDFIHFTLSPDDLAGKLTMIGLEVEAKELVEGDTVFEVNVTPNRPDCLSIFGIARELSAILNIPLKLPEYMVKEEVVRPDFKIEILDPDLCQRYAGRIIKNVKVGESPDWLKRKILQCGMRSVNNIVDVTNYVLIELGHPLHAFDLKTLKGGTIKVGIAGKDNKIKTLDGIERKLPDEALLIWDAEDPIAVAGIMGGLDTEVSDSTKDIFLESAFFNPASIRKTSKTLGLKTEASYRFEREADVEFLSTTLDRAAFLIHQAAGGKVYKKIDVYSKKHPPRSIIVKIDKVNKILGTKLNIEDMISIVKRLNIEVVNKTKESFSITPPSFRLDIKRDIDVIEEIARLYGYHKIKTTIPRAVISAGVSDRRHDVLLAIQDVIRKDGFNEAVNFSFMNEAELDKLELPENDRRRKSLPVKNPLRKEESLLRTTLIPSLINNFMYNFARGVKDIRLFETAKVFENIERPLPLEISSLAGIYYREKSHSLWKDESHSFYSVKGMLESLIDFLHIKVRTFSKSREPFLHPGQSCDINAGGTKVGFVGSLSPVVVDKLDLKITKPEIIIFEIDVDRLISLAPQSIKYSSIPKFPYVERDLAIVVDDEVSSFDIEKLIRAYPSELIEDVSVFDLYKGKNIPDGKKSMAFTIRLRSKNKTLAETDIEELHKGIISYLKTEAGGEVRV
ncbi:MAG: phenylalanine--tRNA ligase subunit beta [Nitrospiraceae bacterium]|nr:phenylalanine--tRNA ligase subunit beta [Nitrospiraceae bacterium]